MNEEAEQALAQIVERAVDGFDGAVLFTQEHLPDVVQQLLLWKMVHSSIVFTLLFVGFVLCVVMLIAFMSTDDPTGEDDESFSAACFFGAIGFFIACMFNLAWLQILIAPKLYLLEYAANLI